MTEVKSGEILTRIRGGRGRPSKDLNDLTEKVRPRAEQTQRSRWNSTSQCVKDSKVVHSSSISRRAVSGLSRAENCVQKFEIPCARSVLLQMKHYYSRKIWL